MFGKLWNLNVLWLQHNKMSGSLPTEARIVRLPPASPLLPACLPPAVDRSNRSIHSNRSRAPPSGPLGRDAFALPAAQLGKLTNLVQRGCYLQNNSFYFCGPPAPPAGADADAGNPLIPTECTTDGPVSPTNWIGPGAIYCANLTGEGGGGSSNDSEGDKEYTAGALYAAPPRMVLAPQAPSLPCCCAPRRYPTLSRCHLTDAAAGG